MVKIFIYSTPCRRYLNISPPFIQSGGLQKGALYVYEKFFSLIFIFAIAVMAVAEMVSAVWAIELPKTGQSKSYAKGDDGELKKGAEWPSPRFAVDKTGDCVTDNLTGLMWTKNANLPTDKRTWQQALDYANNLTICGYDDWRLPNRNELYSLIDVERSIPALPVGYPFGNVQAEFYWSSSTIGGVSIAAWFVDMKFGAVAFGPKTNAFYVWPVRAGQ